MGNIATKLQQYAVKGILISGMLALSGCQTYSSMGTTSNSSDPQSMFLNDLASVTEAQTSAQSYLVSAVDKIKGLGNYRGNDTVSMFNSLLNDLSNSEKQSAIANEKLESVEASAENLFSRWKGNLSNYADSEMREVAEDKLDNATRRYGNTIEAMQNTNARLDNVVASLQNKAVNLKDNLTVSGLKTLTNGYSKYNTELDKLIQDVDYTRSVGNSLINFLK